MVSRDVDEARLKTPAFTDDVVTFAKDALPLLAWGWSVVDAAPSS